MINVYVDKEIMMISAEGHAGHGEKGKDIVCAAVSVLMDMAGREAVRKSEGKAEDEDGVVTVYGNGFRFLCVLDAVTREMKVLEGKYPECVKVTEADHSEDTWEEWVRVRKG